jgi:ribosomal protein L16 Arg81 hydroxylase
MTKMADESAASVKGNGQNYLDSILVRVADEIRILSTMVRTFSRVMSRTSDMQDEGSQTPTGEEPYLTVLRQAWPSISHVAETFNKNEVRLSAKSFRFLGWGLTDVLVSYITECVGGVGKVSRRMLAK